MPIPPRIGVFFIWTLAAMLVPRLLVLNRLALVKWSVTSTKTSWVSPSAEATETCDGLRELLGPQVVQVYGERVYAKAIQNPASLFNSVHRPACVVTPREAKQVQAAMKVIYRDKVRYAVMSGGHTGMTGWNKCIILIIAFFIRMAN
jgi:hypothetical protein